MYIMLLLMIKIKGSFEVCLETAINIFYFSKKK